VDILDNSRPFSIAVLISGGGTTLKNLYEKIDAKTLNVEIKLVVSSSDTAKGLAFAEQNQTPSVVVRLKDCSNAEEFSESIFQACRDAQIDLVVMGGFLKHVLIPKDFENRVINIHPGLIPSFCGHGFYGSRVHQAVLDYGCKVSGCTIHFVDNEFDHGPIISQSTVPVHSTDDANSLAARIFEQECVAYPQAIESIRQGQVTVQGRVVVTQ